MSKRMIVAWVGFLLVFAPFSGAQNLLQDPSFLQTWDPDLEMDVDDPLVCGAPWNQPFSSYWQTSSVKCSRNGTQFVPACPRVGEDREWGSIDFGEPSGRHQFWQTVSGLTTGQAYILSGVWAGGTDAGTPMQFGVELRLGNQTGTIVGTTGGVESGNFNWKPFVVAGTLTSGTDLTVVFYVNNTSWGGKGLHVDDLLLEEGVCTEPPQVSSISQDWGVRAGSLNDIRIDGANFVQGDTTPVLRAGAVSITGTDINVDASGTFLTCDFNLATANEGYMDLAIQKTGCPDAVLFNAIYIVLPGPAITNGSFELPPAFPGGCPVTPQGAPAWWQVGAFGNYGGGLFRDENQVWVPSCPPPHGDHYASTTTSNDGGTLRMDQTFTISQGTTYTLSGYFAGGGANVVKLQLIDGVPTDSLLSEVTIHDGGGGYDWQRSFVAGTPSGPIVTVRWQVSNNGSAEKAAHADNLKLEECVGNVSLSGVSPAFAVNSGPLEGATVTGEGFSGGAAPQLMLIRPGVAIPATSVSVSDDNTLTCNFDIAGRISGHYKLVTTKDGCFDELDNALLVVAENLTNGEFELPVTGDPNVANCASQGLSGGASDWNSVDDWWRDHWVLEPTCPRDVPAPAPPETYGHFASMTTGPDRNLIDQKAWQTVAVTPGRLYRLSGWFAGGGPNTAILRMLDGDENAAAIDSTVIYDCSENCTGQDWGQAEVLGRPTGDYITIVWEMIDATADSATHADGLTLESACNDPAADFDNDGDVDQEDAAMLQLCFTGPSGTMLPGCECFDDDGNNLITTTDVSAFEECASGPNVPANPACDD